MLYSVKLPATERNLLIALIGKPIDAIVTDGWGMELYVSGQGLQIIPEEVSTPDIEHESGDVERPKVTALSQSSIHMEGQQTDHLGIIERVSLLSVLVAFTRPKLGPKIVLPNGAVIPEGMDYGWVYYHPSEKKAIMNYLYSDLAIIDLDIAIELVTDLYRSIIIYTHSFFINVSLDGIPLGEDWARFNNFLRENLNN